MNGIKFKKQQLLLIVAVLFAFIAAESSSHGRAKASGPNVPYHIATWAYDEFKSQGAGASAADVNRLVTYAETGPGNDKALLDCRAVANGCKPVLYFDPNRVYDNSGCPYPLAAALLAQANESWFVHQAGFSDSTHRVRGTHPRNCHGIPSISNAWALNTSSTALQAYFRVFLQKYDAYDYYYMDDTQASVRDQFYFSSGGGCDPNPTICTSTQELPNDVDVQKAASSFVGSMKHLNGTQMSFFFNSLSFNRTPVADLRLLEASARFVGASCEGCATSGRVVHPENYPRILNTMAQFNKRHTIFVILSTGNADAGSAEQLTQRFVTTSLGWLGYSEGYTVVWPDLETNTHNLAVWPEDMIYPAEPLQTMATGESDLQVAPQVWRREFTSCYDRGRLFGRCAAIVNGSKADVVVSGGWLSASYSHVISVTGGDEQSGGKESTNTLPFALGGTVVPAQGAVLLAQ
jgi:hypothetical protein